MRKAIAVLAIFFGLTLAAEAQTIRPSYASQVRFTQLTTAQEGGMTLLDGDVWYNNDDACLKLRSTVSVCIVVTANTVFTQGSILFADANGRLAEDNDGIFFDSGNVRIGIGTATPSVPLHILGGGNTSARFANDDDATGEVLLISGLSAAQGAEYVLGTFGNLRASAFGTTSAGLPFVEDGSGTLILQAAGIGTIIRTPGTVGDSVILADGNGNTLLDCADGGTTGNCKVTGVSILADTGTLAASTTPSVAVGNIFNTASTASITDFTGGVDGQIIYLLCGADTTTSLTDSTPLFLAGAFTCTADDSITLLFDGSVWTEISRSVN